jgi:hypothetical protein
MTDDQLRPFDTLEEVFRLACRGPAPLSIDGAAVAGLPDRAVPLDELRAILLHPSTEHATRDGAISVLLSRARAEGGAATVGLAGVLLFGLRRAVGAFYDLLPGKAADIEAEALCGLLEGIAKTTPTRRHLPARLIWLARNRVKVLVERELTERFLVADTPFSGPDRSEPATEVGHVPRLWRRPYSSAPALPFGHPDLVLAKAVDERVICLEDAALVGDTRLGSLPIAEVAERLGIGLEAALKRRQRAERALYRWITSPFYDADFVQKRPDPPYFQGWGRPRHGVGHDRRQETCTKPTAPRR